MTENVTVSSHIPCDQRPQHMYLEDRVTHNIYEVGEWSCTQRIVESRPHKLERAEYIWRTTDNVRNP